MAQNRFPGWWRQPWNISRPCFYPALVFICIGANHVDIG
ncbi:hypothetical protein AC519_1703 [Pseudomonas savastanoi]|nr:hypothetical protein AC519_1703 [Pseudomonas savastanoi]